MDATLTQVRFTHFSRDCGGPTTASADPSALSQSLATEETKLMIQLIKNIIVQDALRHLLDVSASPSQSDVKVSFRHGRNEGLPLPIPSDVVRRAALSPKVRYGT